MITRGNEQKRKISFNCEGPRNSKSSLDFLLAANNVPMQLISKLKYLSLNGSAIKNEHDFPLLQIRLLMQ